MTVEPISPTPMCSNEARPAQKGLALAILAVPVLSTLLVSITGIAGILAPTSGSAAAMIQRLTDTAKEAEPNLDNPLAVAQPAPQMFADPIGRPTVLRAAAFSGFGFGGTAEDPIGSFVSALDRYPTEVKYEIAPNDTLVEILSAHGVSDLEVQSVTAALAGAKLRPEFWIRQGQTVSMTFGAFNGTDAPRPLKHASVKTGPIERVEIVRSETGQYQAAKVLADLAPRHMLANGTITTSLASTAKAAGVSPTIVRSLTEIYSYDVDFQRDIHPNDSFEVLFTEYVSSEGDVAPGRGDVLFSRLNFKGKSKSYYRYTHADGKTTDYYDESGASVRKFLMKTPISGARLSSGFGFRRHPILGYNKMHRGVDFAAPRGTPVYAAGDGIVQRANRFGTFGNYVKIKHENGYSTAYAHLNGFAKGIKKGTRVRQGQVIAYVGNTGRSTGPHLHYEVARNGKQINPMKIKGQTGIKLAGAELRRFRSEMERIDEARLTHGGETQLAQLKPVDLPVSRN